MSLRSVMSLSSITKERLVNKTESPYGPMCNCGHYEKNHGVKSRLCYVQDCKCDGFCGFQIIEGENGKQKESDGR